jgi:NitT/TauT family transport system permease protein
MTPSTTSPDSRGKKLLKIALPLAVWLGVWQLAAVLVDLELLLPGPVSVAGRLATLAGTAQFWLTAAASLGRIFAGFALGAVVGTLGAAVAAACPPADWILSPAVKVVRATPVASFIVLVLLWAPTGRVPAIIAGLMVLPVLWGNVRKGVDQTDPKLLEAARMYRFSRWKVFRLVYAPSVLPYFASGCSTALGLAWKAGVAAEVLCQPRLAIGARLYGAKITLETDSLFAWTLVVIVLSFLVEYALGFLFRRLGGGNRE